MVLDLRLTKGWDSAESLFYARKSDAIIKVLEAIMSSHRPRLYIYNVCKAHCSQPCMYKIRLRQLHPSGWLARCALCVHGLLRVVFYPELAYYICHPMALPHPICRALLALRMRVFLFRTIFSPFPFFTLSASPSRLFPFNL